jgi:hypothetical protein
VALAIDRMGCDATAAFLGHTPTTPQFARQVLHDFSNLPRLGDFADIYDHAERLYFLDVVINGSGKGLGAFIVGDLNSGESKPTSFHPLNFVSIDWNPALAEGNCWHGKIAAACRVPIYSQRQLNLERLSASFADKERQTSRYWRLAAALFSRRIRSELLATKTLSSLLPMIDGGMNAQDMGTTRRSLSHLAAALAVYRAEHGRYPDRLAHLAPAILPELPVDIYHSKPFIYQRDGEGYLLYSTGPNGIDDGGSNAIYGGGILAGREIGWNEDDATEKFRQQIPEGADDLSIRLPRPPFKLPEPPSAQ